MDADRATPPGAARAGSHGPARGYRVVLRGELGDAFAPLFDGMRLRRRAGLTELVGPSLDQAQLARVLELTQELGLDLIEVAALEPSAAHDPPPHDGADPPRPEQGPPGAGGPPPG
ncbi:hypothetical protein ACTHAM_002576 [Cellulomonas soli]|uniref:hypothetical protein n=1 Tax=Cellulomonas soli TaxID=931535 RepID=UPI003F869FA3